ncbi:AAA family ATPase [Lacrimispora aerotolerans]|uniref:AAA family ATPase n=1 Tax=Lacrimispora aerotolerans TaxID=36832 RepID=UPI000557F992|nr:AAA family ATPase [Lacrimispora aerotolerans]
MYIKEVLFRWPEEESCTYYDEIEALKNTDQLVLNDSVTFFVGENGAGKSTLLEAIAIAYGFNPEGGSLDHSFSSRDTHSSLYKQLLLSKSFHHAKDGFFLRAESFYNFATEIDDIYEGSIRSLHDQSHGESFLSMVQDRFGGKGLYILDEPEAALSPQRQLTLLCEINRLVKSRSQLIIATHSPILLAYPDALIYSFDGSSVLPISYEESEAYQITKLFVENKDYFLNKLLD